MHEYIIIPINLFLFSNKTIHIRILPATYISLSFAVLDYNFHINIVITIIAIVLQVKPFIRKWPVAFHFAYLYIIHFKNSFQELSVCTICFPVLGAGQLFIHYIVLYETMAWQQVFNIPDSETRIGTNDALTKWFSFTVVIKKDIQKKRRPLVVSKNIMQLFPQQHRLITTSCLFKSGRAGVTDIQAPVSDLRVALSKLSYRVLRQNVYGYCHFPLGTTTDDTTEMCVHVCTYTACTLSLGTTS